MVAWAGGVGLGERGSLERPSFIILDLKETRSCHRRHSPSPVSPDLAALDRPGERPRAFQAQYTTGLGGNNPRVAMVVDKAAHGSQGRSGCSIRWRWACSRNSGSGSTLKPGSPRGTKPRGRDGGEGLGGARGGGSCQRPQCWRILRIFYLSRFPVLPPHGHRPSGWSGCIC